MPEDTDLTKTEYAEAVDPTAEDALVMVLTVAFEDPESWSIDKMVEIVAEQGFSDLIEIARTSTVVEDDDISDDVEDDDDSESINEEALDSEDLDE